MSALSWFLAVAFGLSYAGQIAVWASGGLDGPLFAIVAPFLMFTPAVAALVACRLEGARCTGLLRARAAFLPMAAAVLVPAATALVASFVIASALGAGPTPWIAVPGGFQVPEDGPFLWSGMQGTAALLANVVLTAAWLSVMAGLLAVGEEIGWRGYLQPRLCRRFGTLPGLAAVGVLWALWHLPVLLMGYVFPEAPVLGGLVLFPLVGVGLSFFLGWLREATDGIWAPTLAHGSYNAFFGSLVFGMSLEERSLQAYLVIVSLTVLTGLACLPLLRSRARPSAGSGA